MKNVRTQDLVSLQAEFLHYGYVDLTALLQPKLIKRLHMDVHTALNTAGRRLNICISVTDHSPRIYRLATREALLTTGHIITTTYRSPHLLQLLTEITGEGIALVPYLAEEFVATRYEDAGDTHGWHWDDYAFALIWVFEAPPTGQGGTLEFVLNVPWNKAAPRIADYLKDATIHRRHPAKGTVYLLRTDTTLHRVTPLQGQGRREILCFSYATPSDLQREITHETIEVLTSFS